EAGTARPVPATPLFFGRGGIRPHHSPPVKMDFCTRLCQKSWFVMKKTFPLIALFAGAAWTVAAAQSPSPAPAASPEATPVSSNIDRESHTGRSFVILFDDIHLTIAGGQRAKAAVAQFLKTGVREGDRVSLVATGGGAWWSTRMEAGRDELMALLKRLDGRF